MKQGVLDELPEMADEGDDDDDVWEEEERADVDDEAGDSSGRPTRKLRLEVTFDLFCELLWPLMVGKERVEAGISLADLRKLAHAKDLQVGDVTDRSIETRLYCCGDL